MEISDLVSAIVTLAATFIGAHLAFRYEGKRKESEEVKRRIAAANRALFTLFDYWNVLVQYQREIIQPNLASELTAWYDIPATTPTQLGIRNFDIAELNFLLGSPDPMVCASLLLEEKRTLNIVDLIDSRSRTLISELQPKLEAAGFGHGSKISVVDLERIAGPNLHQRLVGPTVGITSGIPQNLASIEKAFRRLRTTMATMYPSERLINCTFDIVTPE